MARHNPANTRIKREYFHYLKHAQRRDEQSIDQVAKAIARFEEATGHKDFRKFLREQAVAFKNRLDGERNARTIGRPNPRANLNSRKHRHKVRSPRYDGSRSSFAVPFGK